MRSLGWPLIQCDWCVCKKMSLRHRYTQRKDEIEAQGEGGLLYDKTEAQKKPALPRLGLGLPASRVVRRKYLLFKVTLLVVLCYRSLKKLIYIARLSIHPSIHLFSIYRWMDIHIRYGQSFNSNIKHLKKIFSHFFFFKDA